MTDSPPAPPPAEEPAAMRAARWAVWIAILAATAWVFIDLAMN